ncbi:methyltransferase domain-containing protein [Desulfovibrio sp. ZJ200]|uniref:methyltransferase domain-containing protein n=1 Tax=Desulfovibrio sp. ZJ200 TaxID=2709792 RepID=UPI0013EB39DE|nr:methyltransferase domain-containing protein [Desulfovibrio sp. ZJ200]
MSDAKPKRRVALTVDVEAHPIRAARDHVNRLIWGRQQGREAGIQTMMDIADRHGVTMTFFLDYPEVELYGGELLDVGREIRRRGHDLEPHCHLEYIVKSLFGLDDPWSLRLPRANLHQSLKIVDWLVNRHESICGQKPLAYRSGAYLIGPDYLEALKRSGIVIDASYSLRCPENPFRIGLRGPFLWENGLREIPVPFIPYFTKSNHLVAWNFNFSGFLQGSASENAARHKTFLDTWFRRHGDDAVAALIMHSWSFWKMDAQGFFSIPEDRGLESFEAMLTMLQKNFEIIPLSRLAEDEAPAELEKVSAREQDGHCPVCCEPVSHFQDYNGGAKRRCAFCSSVERQRTLVDLVYAGALGPHVFTGKDILHIAPGWPETLLLRRMRECRVTTLNIQPGCDLTANISAMPEVQDNSYDIVLASEVFRHVRHFDRALAEIHRVLRPGGLLICSDCLENADYGREITDIAEQISWYGKEKLEQFDIGDFRRFGRKDWAKSFEPYFYTRLFKVNDQATGSPAWWLACTPRNKRNRQCGA